MELIIYGIDNEVKFDKERKNSNSKIQIWISAIFPCK